MFYKDRMLGKIYSVVVVNDLGGKTLNSYNNKKDAERKGREIVRHIKTNNVSNIDKVYLSELKYDNKENLILDNDFINSKSIKLY